jgi:hypothetical protein
MEKQGKFWGGFGNMVYMEVCPFGIEMMKKKRYEFLTPQ